MTNRVAVRPYLFSSKLIALVVLLLRKCREKFLPEDFDPQIYLALNPDVEAANADAAEHYLSHGIEEGRLYKRYQFPEEISVQNYSLPNSSEIAEQVDTTGHGLWPKRIGAQAKITALLNSRFAPTTPLCTFAMRHLEGAARITMVTDSVTRSSLLGGVGTALIFCAMLANRMGASLRIATRTEPSKSSDIEPFLKLYRVHVDHGVQFAFAPLSGESHELDIFENDLFVTTSWWSTAATLNAVDPSSILYLLQEDERMFYPFGDDRHRCETIMSNREIRFIVNTELLFNHLVSTGLDNITARGAWFEPAFPNWIYKRKTRRNGSKRKLFFYARPDNPRNMFYLGIEVIDRAIQSGVLDLSVWDVYLAGRNIPALEFTSGYQPKYSEGLTWKDYAALIGTVDLGLSLMYSPHPSYPPLDLAASGALVVTNRFLNKQDLSKYSPNVICADLDLQSLIDALSQAIALTESQTEDSPAEIENPLNTDWHKSFDHIITDLLASD